MRDADRVRDLDLAAVGEAGRDDVLRDVARRVGGRAVDLRRILARERAAAVRGGAAVGVDDDLAPGQARVAHRAADHELPGRVDVDEVAVSRAASRRTGPCGRIGRSTCSIRSGLISESASRPSRCCVEMSTRSISTGRCRPSLVDLVAHRHLRLPVRPQVRQHVGLPHLRQPLRDAVREHDRQRHQLARLVRRVAEHHSLVAGADRCRADRRRPDRAAPRTRCRRPARCRATARRSPRRCRRSPRRSRISRGCSRCAVIVARTSARMSMYVSVVISPATTTRPVVISVSQATRLFGSFARTASRTASEIWSAILSG